MTEERRLADELLLVKAKNDSLNALAEYQELLIERQNERLEELESIVKRAGILCSCGSHDWVCCQCVHRPALKKLNESAEKLNAIREVLSDAGDHSDE